MRHSTTTAASVAAVALSYTLATQDFYAQVNSSPSPLLTVRACSEPPTIDGTLGAGEWDDAAGAMGMADLGSHELAPIQPTFWFTFDEHALYIAVAVPLQSGVRLRTKHRGRDTPVYEDDSIELFLAPKREPNRYYHFVANAAGALYDARNRDKNWNAKTARWASAASARQWVLEMAVPFGDLDAIAPADGARWGANVCLNLKTPRRMACTWAAVGSSFHEPANFSDIAFTRSGPAVMLAGTRSLLSGTGELKLKLLGSGPATSSLTIWPAEAAGEPVVDVQSPGTDSWLLPFELPAIPPGGDAASYRGQVRVLSGESPVLLLPFAMTVGAAVNMHIRAYPDTKQLAVELSAEPMRLDPAEHSLRVAVAPRGRPPTRTVELPQLAPEPPTTVTFEGRDVSSPDLTVTAAVMDRTGRVVFEQTRDLSAPLNPWWLDDDTGADDVILPPYKPLRVEGQTVRPWGRVYQFGRCLMPATVETAGAEVLAAPVTLSVTADGRRLTWQGDAPTVTTNRPERVEFSGTAQCAAFELAGTARIDYDGMIRVDLELTPKGKPHVDELTLEIPLKPEHAEYLYHFPGKWQSVANSGKLPEAGFRHAFKPFIWLGDNDRGFSWFCESAENWLPEDREDAVTITREPGRVVLRLHLIRGEKIASPLAYTFGFEATPVKKPDKTVWDYRISHRGGYGIQSQPATADGASIQYKAQGSIRGDRGTAEMWIGPSLDSDPAKAGEKDHTQIPNVTLFWLEVDEKTNCGLFWCGPPQQLRIWSRVDDKVLTTLSTPVKWQTGELHHVAFSWGDELRLYVNGELRATQTYQGLMPKALDHAVLHVGRFSSPNVVDEIRISDVPRAPQLDEQPYTPDEHTLLLDHLDLDIKPFRTQSTLPTVATGGPGGLLGAPVTTAGKHGKGLRLRGDRPNYTLLEHLAESGVRTLCFHSQWSWMGYPMPPPEREKDLRDLVEACHAKGIQLLLYASPLTADEAPEWDLYSDYFLISPLKWPYRYSTGHLAPACCWQSRYRNLWLARQARLLDEYDIDGFYLDGSEWPLWCRNQRHGCGYKRKDGTIGQTCNIFATRDYMKRLYVLCKTRKPEAQVNIHNSTVMVIPTLGWGTSSWGGEQLGSLSWDKGGAVEKHDYALEALPLDAFRTEFMGRQWGVPSEFLCYERPYTTPQVLAITLLHHVLVRPNMPHLPRLSALWRLHDTFGMKEAAWHPYWSNGDTFQTSADHVKVSAYQHPQNGLLLLVSNLSSEPTTASVQVDANRLGMALANSTARDAISAEPLDLAKHRVTLDMDPFSYRYVWIE